MNKRHLLLMLIVFNETQEILTRLKEKPPKAPYELSPTRIDRFPVRGIAGSVNVANVYYRIKRQHNTSVTDSNTTETDEDESPRYIYLYGESCVDDHNNEGIFVDTNDNFGACQSPIPRKNDSCTKFQNIGIFKLRYLNSTMSTFSCETANHPAKSIDELLGDNNNRQEARNLMGSPPKRRKSNRIHTHKITSNTSLPFPLQDIYLYGEKCMPGKDNPPQNPDAWWLYTDSRDDNGSCELIPVEGEECYWDADNGTVQGVYKRLRIITIEPPHDMILTCETSSRKALSKEEIIKRNQDRKAKREQLRNKQNSVPLPAKLRALLQVKRSNDQPVNNQATNSTNDQSAQAQSQQSSNQSQVNQTPNSNSNDASMIFSTEEAYSPYVDIFRNETFKMTAGSHGLTFLKTGRAFKWSDYWTQYVRLETPSISTLPIETYRETVFEYCAELYAAYLKKKYANVPTRQEVENEIDAGEYCKKNFRKNLEDSADELQTILSARYNRYLKTNNRKKRFVLAAMGIAAVGGIGLGFWLSKGNDNSKQLKKLSEDIAINREKTKLLENAMIGLSQINNARFEQTNERITLLAKTTKKQFERIQTEVSKQMTQINTDIYLMKTEQLIKDFIDSSVEKLQNLLIAHLESFQFWDQVFIQLRKGFIPRQLYDKTELNDLLLSIESKLQNIFKVALDPTDWLQFYSLPVVTYRIQKEGSKSYLYLKIKIPIRRHNEQSQYDIITPNVMPFPCSGTKCFLKEKTTRKLVSFKLPQTVLLVNPVNAQVDWEANLDHFSCHQTYYERLCFSYHSELLQVPNSCIMSVINWNTTGILSECKFEPRDENEYRVIKYNDYQFLIHGTLVGTVQEECDREEMKSKNIANQWAMIMSVKKGCQIVIPKTRQRLYGAYSEPLVGTTYKNTNINSQLIVSLSEKLNPPRTKIEPIETQNISAYDSELWKEIDEKLQDESISNLNKVAFEITKQLSTDMNRLNKNFVTFSYSSTFWGVFSIAADVLQVMITLFLLFTTLTYSRFFGAIGLGVRIIQPRPVAAWSIIPEISLLPEIDVQVLNDTTFVSWLSKVALVSIFLLFMLVSSYTKWFRTVRMTLHYGRTSFAHVPQENTKFCVQLNIYNKNIFFNHMTVENVYVKVPITQMPMQDVHDIKCKNLIVTWAITETSIGKTLVVTDDIHLIAYNRDGKRMRNRNQKISIPIDSISWTSNPTPRSLELINNFDFAVINIIKEPEIDSNTVEKPGKRIKNSRRKVDDDSEGYALANISTTVV